MLVPRTPGYPPSPLTRRAHPQRTQSVHTACTTRSGHDIHVIVPPEYWSARPDATNTDPTRQMLKIAGGVMLRTRGRLSDTADVPTDLSPELTAALNEPDPRPLRSMPR